MLRGVTTFHYDDEFRLADQNRWLRSIEVEVQGAGGGGGGAARTLVGQGSAGGGGGAGGYARAFYTADELPDVVYVMVGEAGRPGWADEPNEVAGRGGTTRFHTAAGQGGRCGGAGPASDRFQIRVGGSAGHGSGGYLNVAGQPGFYGFVPAGGTPSRGGQGGPSHLSGGARNPLLNEPGRTAVGYGGGGSGASNNPGQPPRFGGWGAPGIVIVRLYG